MTKKEFNNLKVGDKVYIGRRGLHTLETITEEGTMTFRDSEGFCNLLSEDWSHIVFASKREADAWKYCYDCVNYYEDTFCGYRSPCCRIMGSLGMDQQAYHPDITANECEHYKQRDK